MGYIVVILYYCCTSSSVCLADICSMHVRQFSHLLAREAFPSALGVGSLLLPEPQSTEHCGREALLIYYDTVCTVVRLSSRMRTVPHHYNRIPPHLSVATVPYLAPLGARYVIFRWTGGGGYSYRPRELLPARELGGLVQVPVCSKVDRPTVCQKSSALSNYAVEGALVQKLSGSHCNRKLSNLYCTPDIYNLACIR